MPQTVHDRSRTFFFDERASQIPAAPNLVDLCYVSGRDARIWVQPGAMEDLARSVREQLAMDGSESLLEVGCAAGFLACYLVDICGAYVGVDLAPAAVERACSLGLPHARFQTADGAALPFADNTFDRAVCYDVFINIDSMDVGAGVMADMVRVTKPGGSILIGAVPDAARQAASGEFTRDLQQRLDKEFGPIPAAALRTAGVWSRFRHWWLRRFEKLEPRLCCYFHAQEAFHAIGEKLGCAVEILKVHDKNPYHAYRFNARLTKPNHR
jgi:ubiquinone/menaquinone biosynthesis C-methylase UbiE